MGSGDGAHGLVARQRRAGAQVQALEQLVHQRSAYAQVEGGRRRAAVAQVLGRLLLRQAEPALEVEAVGALRVAREGGVA